MASTPAIRAAVTTWARAKCQKSPGYSVTGPKLPSTRARSDADRSPAPKINASRRSLARAISTALARPSASSISTSSAIRRSSPSLASNWVRRTSYHQTSRAERAFGTMSTSSASRAPVTISITSPWHQGVSRPFTRTARTVRPQSSSVSADTAVARAPSLATGAHASSRSRNTRSAPDLAAFSHMRSLLAGLASSDRRARGAYMSDDARGPQGGDAVRVDAEQAAEDGVVVGPERTPEVLDPARRVGQDRDRRLHGRRPQVGIVDGDEGAPGAQVLVLDELLRVVDGRRRQLRRLEDPHGLVERALADPLGDEGVELDGAVPAADRVHVGGVVGQVGPVDRPEQAHSDTWRRAGDRQPVVVGGAVSVAGRAGVEAVVRPVRDDPELGEGERLRLDQAGPGLDQVDVDELPAAAVDVAVVEGHDHRVGSGEGGDPVGQHERRQCGRPVGLSGHVGEPAHRLGQRPVAGPVALGPAPAVAADVEHHDAGMGPVDRLVVDAPSRQGARAVGDDEDVADVEQPVEQLLPLRLAEVERDAALVAAHALPGEADAVAAVAPRAHRIAGAPP